jgi:hypothetical protein
MCPDINSQGFNECTVASISLDRMGMRKDKGRSGSECGMVDLNVEPLRVHAINVIEPVVGAK